MKFHAISILGEIFGNLRTKQVKVQNILIFEKNQKIFREFLRSKIVFKIFLKKKFPQIFEYFFL
jgi:hypothetical protein